ncbi:MAG: ABC transporter ATP-binding protein [Rhodospirillum sp.]|nr:ABC transporter ATP-binding protein [Rhodospirillum sp.]MCF8489564.1 ABC transporter ATP-binding protein [Rhodospirillum sp.]MCF8501596.1 ABC transporter ATP-binding protein [Rhodospirillum sp.]
MDLLTVENLHVGFRLPRGELDAISGVSFSLPQGGTLAVVGESGSGKSVTARAVMGLLPASARIKAGRVLFADPKAGEAAPIDLTALPPDGRVLRAIRGNAISMVFQEPLSALSPVHTIGDQIGEVARLHRGMDRAAARRETREILSLVRFPDPDRVLDSYPFELSGGMRQRALIGMALISRPRLLIADEPTTALDVTVQAEILALLHDLRRDLGMAILIITHDMGVVASLAEDVVVMKDGRCLERGPTRAVLKDPRHAYTQHLLSSIPRHPNDLGPNDLGPNDLGSNDLGPNDPGPVDPSGSQFRAQPSPAPLLLEAEGLDMTFQSRAGRGFFRSKPKETRALTNVDLTLRQGECLGIVGESGSGKSTLSRILMRAITPDRGCLRFHGGDGPLDLLGLNARDLRGFRRHIQTVFQDPVGSLSPRRKILDILREPLEIQGIGTPASRRAMALDLITLVGLTEAHLDRFPHSLSGGQKQRVGIARALALEPEILILDEAVSALDVSIQARILALLQDLRQRLRLSYIFISHDMGVINQMADRIMVLCGGYMVETAPREALFARPSHPYTRSLLAAVPRPDPDHPLDLEGLRGGRANIPARWPLPFARDGEPARTLIEVGPDHWVRAAPTPPTSRPAEGMGLG